VPRDYVTDARPREPVDPDFVAAHGPNAIAWADEDDRRLAYHEAGHATIGALYGRPAEFAVLGPTPHVLCLPKSKRTFEAVLIGLLAGKAAEGCAQRRRAHPPGSEEMGFYLAKAREGTVGSCDSCKVAQLLLIVHTHEGDDSLAERWRAHFVHTADLFDDVFVRSALVRVARALQEKRRLDRDELQELIGPLTPPPIGAF
jgi:hypothetical protein